MKNSIKSLGAWLTVSLTMALGMTSCGSSETNSTAEEVETLTSQAISTDSLLSIASEHVGDTLCVRGYVRHTCKHSGRRCFISDAKRENQIRVEAGGKIGGFNKELIGSEIAVRGALQEYRKSKEDVEKQIVELTKKAEGLTKEDGSAEQCDIERGNLDAQMAYMDERGLDYYPIYYIDGVDYEEIAK